MRTEVADNWFAVVNRFTATSLRMIFVGQTGCRCNHVADFGERLCDIVKKNVNILVLFVAGGCFQAIPLITLWLFMFSLGCIL